MASGWFQRPAHGVAAAVHALALLILLSASAFPARADILADAYLGLYLQERYPALCGTLIDFHLSRRTNAAVTDPEHDTARFLTGLSFQNPL